MTSTQIQHWQSQLADLSVTFTEAFGHLTPEQLNWKPNTKTWSVGQILEHIILVNASYFDIPKQIEAGTYKYPFLARFAFFPRMMGNMIHKSVLPETQRKQPTMRMWEPAQSQVEPNILERFRGHQAELIQFIGENHELVEKGMLVCSPANKLIVYPIGKAFEIMISHEERHLQQAMRVMEMREAKGEP